MTAVEPLRLAIDGEPKSKSEKPSKGKNATSGDVTRVFDAYEARWREHGGNVGDEPKRLPRRVAQIRARLREGYTVERIARAFDGMFANAWNRRENKLGIEWVISAGSRVEECESKPTSASAAPTRPSWTGPIKQAPAPADAHWRTKGAEA